MAAIDDAGAPAGGASAGTAKPALRDLIKQFDWSSTTLGPMSGWPPSLRVTVDLILRSPIAIVTLWGPEGYLIYNDAYAEFAQQRHPHILGKEVLKAWPEAVDLNRRVLATCFDKGDTLSMKDQPLQLYRHDNIADQVWLDLDYSPVIGEDGRPEGVLAVVVETTEKVLAEQALALERAAVLDINRRLSAESAFLRDLFEQAPSFIALLSGPDHVFALANHAYKRLIGNRDIVGKATRDALPEVVEQGFIALLDEVYTTGKPFLGSGMRVNLAMTVGGEAGERMLDFIYQPIRAADGTISGIFVEGQDVTERMRGEQHLRLVVNELNHRVKNTLATIQAIATQTFRQSGDLEQAQKSFTARIMALARANDLLTAEGWESASMDGVAAGVAEALAGNDPGRFRTAGPVVRLSPKSALAVSMALHELATNAVKYGALSNASGYISLTWDITDSQGVPMLKIDWRESGGPPVVPPKTKGFGTRLIERGLAGEPGGSAQLLFAPSGVVCSIEAPLDLNTDGRT